MQKQCTFPGCDRPLYAKSYCLAHYKQWFAGKELVAVSPKRKKNNATFAEDVAEFWNRVRKVEGGCWEWMRGRSEKTSGYGLFRFQGESEYTHRISWVLNFGPITDGLFVLHKCDNRPCVNPDHLFLGTHLDNVSDMLAKGRNRGGRFCGEDAWNARFTDRDVIEMRRLRSETSLTLKEIGVAFGTSATVVCRIVLKKAWAHI